MFRTAAYLAPLIALTIACSDDATVTDLDSRAAEGSLVATSTTQAHGLVRKEIPAEDPGPPFYARVTRILDQFFHDDGWLAIPFYRPPECVPGDFDLLGLFDFPGPGGPGAFACPLLFDGFLLTEPDAPPGRFPRHVVLEGSGTPVWFVPWGEFLEAANDGAVTVGELEALDPLIGTTRRYHEMLKPREGDHLIVIDAAGELDDGRDFSLHVTHIEDRTRSVRIQFR